MSETNGLIRAILEDTSNVKCIAPRVRHYYCEYCKENVLPMDANIRLELTMSFVTCSAEEIEIARHKACGNVLKEKFWNE